jgi:hypothetical protein
MLHQQKQEPDPHQLGAVEAQNGATIEVWRLKMEPWWFCRQVVVDSHHFYEEQDPDPYRSDKSDPHQRGKGDPEQNLQVMQIRNTV